ncbi:MAG: AlpA family phage regulatory protein [Magnetococcales bacterium]|nr:AlpA family phage regulatory protein [Magnetococcales bacterium]
MQRSPLLPDVGFLRLSQIIGDPNAVPPIPAIVPVSKSTWWNGVKTGRFPKPVKLGPRTTAWPVGPIKQLIADLSGEVSS